MKAYILIIFLIAQACGSAKKSDSSNSTDSALVGTWKSGCVDSSIYESVIKLDGTETATVYDYQDTQCQTLLMTTMMQKTWVTSGDQDIDFTVVKAIITPNIQSAADSLNQSVEYGFNNWSVSAAKDVTGLKPSSTDTAINKGDKIYQIYKITDSNTLVVGDPNKSINSSGVSPDTRPTTFDENTIYKKQ